MNTFYFQVDGKTHVLKGDHWRSAFRVANARLVHTDSRPFYAWIGEGTEAAPFVANWGVWD